MFFFQEKKGSSRFRVGRLRPEAEKAAKKEALAERIGIILQIRGDFFFSCYASGAWDVSKHDSPTRFREDPKNDVIQELRDAMRRRRVELRLRQVDLAQKSGFHWLPSICLSGRVK